jgi:uncharacterized protein YndB with AHSA1/START domain
MAIAATKQKPTITIVRKFKAAPEKVWRAWTDAQTMTQWFAPGDAFSVLAEADVRVGGRYRIVMKAPDGEEHDVSGIYREVHPKRKLVFTWAWKSTPERESLVSVELRAAGSGTELTLTHAQFFDAAARDRHQHGWDGCIGRLEHMLSWSA